jgi:uncharacterized integral membrane protein
VATRRTAAKSQDSTGNGTKRSGRATSRTAKKETTATTGAAASNGTNGSAASTGRRRARTSEASAAGATARARIAAARRSSAKRAGTRPNTAKAEASIAEPTVTATDEVLAASNAQKALSPDMPRVAWLRTQLQNIEAQRAERLMKVAQLALIAIIFITFVLQNAQPVNVHFLLFSLNIRLIWVIFGCGVLGGVAGYLIGRPDKSLRALLPQKEKPARGRKTARTS